MSSGGGGLGAGADVFVQQGGVLTVAGTGTLAAGTVTGGVAGGAAGNHAVAGSAYGSGLFIQGNQTVTFAPGAGQTLTIAGTVADQSGNGGTGANAGAGALDIQSGTLSLAAANSFTGGTSVAAGAVLDLAANGASGSGGISGAGAVTIDASQTLVYVSTYTGGTTVNAGYTLTANIESTNDGVAALGTGTLTLNGGTFSTGTNVTNNAIAIGAGGGTLTGTNAGFDTSIAGSAPLTLAGTSLSLNSDDSGFTGAVAITGTMVSSLNPTDLSAANALTVSGASTFSISASGGNGPTRTVGSLAGSGTVTADYSQGSTTAPTAERLVTGGDNTSTTFSGTITNSLTLATYAGKTTLGLTKTGTGTFTLSSANTFSGGTTISQGTLDLGAASSAGTGAITFAGATGSLAVLSLETAAQPASGGTFGDALAAFGNNDELDLKGLAYSGAAATPLTALGGKLSVTEGGKTESFTLTNPGAVTYFAQSDSSGGTLITDGVVCFCSDTRIRTSRGEIAVEHLAVGDVAVTATGAHRPIVWIGWKKVACANVADPETAWPVRVAAHAFAHNVPERDLYLSPGHAVVPPGEAVLIPIGHLVNGTTITRDPRASVTYWHVELDQHDLLLAEGLAAESFIDVGVGDRAWFENGHAVEERRLGTYADMCVPYFKEWDRVDATKALLARRAAAGARKRELLLCGAF